jgi:hypothetical protein
MNVEGYLVKCFFVLRMIICENFYIIINFNVIFYVKFGLYLLFSVFFIIYLNRYYILDLNNPLIHNKNHNFIELPYTIMLLFWTLLKLILVKYNI